MKAFGKILILLLALVVVAGLPGCKKHGKKVADEPEDETLLGIDADHDGIRDNVMAKMKKDFYMIAPDEMKVLEQNARVFQEILETRPEDRTGILLARGHLDDAFNCGITVYGEELNYDNFSVMLTQLRQWYFDNPKRKAAHQEFLLRSREYMYQPLNLEGNNTCEFELSPETLRLIEIRTEIKKQKEARKAVNNS
ncbi:hypothetical protein [Succinimonas amylolytica]|uniref:hypothetical protein n=1 Tax=Succinimonas amylolytica TaxID=83769 RepID=UPI00037CA48F|nr:hypothetical protein [Succinimonas amylolytica]